LLEDVTNGKITDPIRMITIKNGKSILQPSDSFDSDDSDLFFDIENDLVINELDGQIKEEKMT